MLSLRPGVGKGNSQQIAEEIAHFARAYLRNGQCPELDGRTLGIVHCFYNIHLIPKWRPINYSFVCMLISP